MQFLPILLPQTSYFCRMLYPLASFWLTLEPLYLSIHIFISKLTILVWVVQLRTANGTSMDTYGSRQIALQFGPCHFDWTFLLADVSMPILGSDFLRHHHLLVDVVSACLLDAATLEPIPTTESCLLLIPPSPISDSSWKVKNLFYLLITNL